MEANNQDHKIYVQNFIEWVKTRNFQTPCTIENVSLCAKYAYLANIADRMNTALIYDDVTKSFKDALEADKFLKPVYRATRKFPE